MSSRTRLSEGVRSGGESRSSRARVALILVPSIAIAVLLATFYLVIKPLFPIVNQYYFPEQTETFVIQQVPLMIHIVGGATALIAGAVNAVAATRGRFGRHRVVGIVYVVAVAFSAPAGIVLATTAYGGTLPGGAIIATSGFVLLGVLWLATTMRAVAAIVRHDRRAHGAWMLLSFSLAFAAVTLRLYVAVLTVIGVVAFEAVYPLLAWLCWVPNIAVAAVIVRRRLALPVVE